MLGIDDAESTFASSNATSKRVACRETERSGRIEARDLAGAGRVPSPATSPTARSMFSMCLSGKAFDEGGVNVNLDPE